MTVLTQENINSQKEFIDEIVAITTPCIDFPYIGREYGVFIKQALAGKWFFWKALGGGYQGASIQKKGFSMTATLDPKKNKWNFEMPVVGEGCHWIMITSEDLNAVVKYLRSNLK